jgi:hypothetical protein
LLQYSNLVKREASPPPPPSLFRGNNGPLAIIIGLCGPWNCIPGLNPRETAERDCACVLMV